MRQKILLCAVFASTIVSAESWTGFLVDADCYNRERRNTRPAERSVDQDTDYEVRYCAPSAKTKTFELVDRDGRPIMLDQQGSAKAADLVRSRTEKAPVEVIVNGSRTGNVVKVDSIQLQH